MIIVRCTMFKTINNNTIKNNFIKYQKYKISSTKLNYNEFYKSIGNPKYISAPMVDSSELAWRILVRRNGCDLAFSQMMHGRNFLVDSLNYRVDCMDWIDYRTNNNDIELEKQGKQLDNSLIVQLASDDSDILIKVGKILETNQQIKGIDLNLGCPQKIAKRGNYGAYLLPNKKLIVNLLSNMVKNINCNITAKIRKLPSDEDTIDLCKAIEDCGVSMLTVHGRTVESSKLFTGEVDWDIIKKIKKKLSIPVIANGGISNRKDVIKCLEITGADGVMSSEALLENPKLFSEEGDYLFHNDFINSQLNTVEEYVNLVQLYPQLRSLYRDKVVRGHLFKMLYRFTDAPLNDDLRTKLSTCSFEEMFLVIDTLRTRLKTVDNNEKKAIEKGFLNTTTWYNRHRDEKAFKRVISPRRIDKRIIDNEELDKDELKFKLFLLKEKLVNNNRNNNRNNNI